MDASTGGVEGELADWDTHSVDTQITKTEDARAICDDGDLNLVWPVLDYRVKVATVCVGEVEAFGLGVEFGPALASFSNSGCVDEGGHFLKKLISYVRVVQT